MSPRPNTETEGVITARRDAAAKHLAALIHAEVFDRVFDAANAESPTPLRPVETAGLASDATLRVLSREDAMSSLRELVATGGVA